MEKTKFGLSIGLMGFIGYVLGGCSGLWVIALLMIFVLMTETNEVLRINMVQATILAAVFAVLNYLLSGYDAVANVTTINALYRLGSFVRSCVSVAEIAITLMAAMGALSGKVMTIPVVTPLVKTHFSK